MEPMLGTSQEGARRVLEFLRPLLVFLGGDLAGVLIDLLNKLADDGSERFFWALKKFLRGDEKPFDIPMDTDSQLKRVCALYAKALGITIDPASVKIPERKSGFDRLIVVPAGLGLNQLIAFFKTKFDVSLYIEDLDGDVKQNDRKNDETYVIWVRDVVEADEKLKNLSANQLQKQNISGVTLLERLVHELLYYMETGKHLDVVNWTLCSGSRYSDGDVPFVSWGTDDRKLRVGWSDPDHRNDRMRARAVVSLSAAA